MLRIITSLVAVLSIVSVNSQTTHETPKLVIGITIDQLRGDYIELFKHTFTERGFKRLLNEGLVYQNMAFDFPDINTTAAIATIYTGANPFYNGIVAGKKYSFEKGKEVSVFDDNTYLGNYTSEKLSPKALKVSTIADELKLASQGFSDVYSFAPDAADAIVTAGHAANCAFWVEDYSGKWATTTFYKDLHWTVDQENRNSIYSNYAGSLTWKPLLGIESYNAFPYTQNKVAFHHGFDSFLSVKKSPLVNENIRNTSLKLFEKAELGKRTYPDFLALTFYLGNFPKQKTKTIRSSFRMRMPDLTGSWPRYSII